MWVGGWMDGWVDGWVGGLKTTWIENFWVRLYRELLGRPSDSWAWLTHNSLSESFEITDLVNNNIDKELEIHQTLWKSIPVNEFKETMNHFIRKAYQDDEDTYKKHVWSKHCPTNRIVSGSGHFYANYYTIGKFERGLTYLGRMWIQKRSDHLLPCYE